MVVFLVLVSSHSYVVVVVLRVFKGRQKKKAFIFRSRSTTKVALFGRFFFLLGGVSLERFLQKNLSLFSLFCV